MSHMAAAVPDPWTLMTVLISTFPITPALAVTLHQTAWSLYQSGEAQMPVAGDFAAGRVVNLKRRVLLGDMGGPAFEAELETERGAGHVRFFLTEQGIS